MKKREQIPNEYKWNLSSYIKDKIEIDKIFKIMENLINILPKYSGKLENPDILFERLEKYKDDFILISKLAHYISHMINVDSANTEILVLEQKFSSLYTKLSEADAYMLPQMYELPNEYLNSLLKDSRFKDYDNLIKDIIKLKPHKIDEKTNLLLSKMGNFIGNNENIHSILVDSELQFDDVLDSNGKKHKLDNSTYPKYVKGKDSSLRKNAFNSRIKGFAQLNKTFAELYLKDIEYDKFLSALTNYSNLLESVLLEDDIPKAVFDNIIKFTEKNIPLLQDYCKTRAKISKNKKFAYYDLFEDEKNKSKISLDTAINIIKNSLIPLGDDYLSNLNRKLNDQSIDYFPNENKNSGGYCSHCYDANTVILVNYLHDYNSVSTLCHELGHCINAEYFLQNQPYEKADITIFAAEIASTTNEILLNQYMLKTSNKNDKKYYLRHFLDNVRSTIFRQIIFTEFELYAHQTIEKDIPITYMDLNNHYLDLNKKFYGKSLIIPENLKYEWMCVPHFYSPYYVFTYATGLVCACVIANRLLSDNTFHKQYLNFLKNGTSKPAVDALKAIDIDLTTDKPYKEAFEFIEKQLNTYKSLYK